jgi:hypothetical protein
MARWISIQDYKTEKFPYPPNMELTSIIFTFLYFQGAFLSTGNNGGVAVEGLTDRSDTSEVSPRCHGTGEVFGLDDKAPVPSTFKDDLACDMCLKFLDLTSKMEKVPSSGMGLKERIQEKGAVSPNNSVVGRIWDFILGAFWYKKVGAAEATLEEILVSISETFKCVESEEVRNAYEGPFGEKLLVVLEIVRNAVCCARVVERCKGGSSGTCAKFSRLSVPFIYEYLWGVEYCIDEYCSGKCATDEYCAHKYGTAGDGSDSGFFVYEIIIILCQISAFGQSASGETILTAGYTLHDIGKLADSCIKYHFSNEKCLKLLSEGLKKDFSRIYSNLEEIKEELLSTKGCTDLERLARSLLVILDIVTCVYGGSGWERFHDPFHEIESCISQSILLMKCGILGHGGGVNEKITRILPEREMERVRCICETMTGLSESIRENNKSPRY